MAQSPEVQGVPDGIAMHVRIPAKLWGLSRSDLKSFRRLVRTSIGDGTLTQTDFDKFKAEDDAIGPCVRTVVLQLIKPITAKAGNMSWSLMLHPNGLHCDIFVTHCWSEGMLEFIDKVVGSWPSGARGGAYCCMFSNPQNGDIGSLIASPRESPFAHALTDARYMMVVPNSEVSIYSRIWCAYEAFLAYEKKKMIFTAVTPARHAWVYALRVFAMFLVLAAVCTCAFLPLGGPDEEHDWKEVDFYEVMGVPTQIRAVFALVLIVATVLLLRAQIMEPYSRAQRWRMILSALLHAITIGFYFRTFLFTLTDEAYFDTKYRAQYFGFQALGLWIFMLSQPVAIALLEIDNVWAKLRETENKALRRGYTGHLADAESSVQADKDTIFQELQSSGMETACNHAVYVLIENGMSTSRLRKVVDRVGELNAAGYWNLSYLFFGLSTWGVLTVRYLWTQILLYTHYTMYRHVDTGSCECLIRGALCVEAGTCEENDTCSVSGLDSFCKDPRENPFFWITFVNFLMSFIWAFVFSRLNPDLSRFATISMTRVQIIGFVVTLIIDVAAGAVLMESNVSVIYRFLQSIVTFVLLMMGPARLALVPGIGRPLTRFFFANTRFSRKKDTADKDAADAPPAGDL